MILQTLLWFSFPLSALAVMLGCGSAGFLKVTRTPPPRLLSLAQVALVLMWLGSCVFAAVSRSGFRDWNHLFFATQYPLLGLFAGSGALLCRTWRRDAEWIDGSMASAAAARGPVRRRLSGAWIFLAMAATLALLPLPLEIALPEDRPAPRETGAPIAALGELIAWGFGGPLPAALVPDSEVPPQVERGVGHLPRDVTVPFATTWLGACLWMCFCALAFVGRFAHTQPKRLIFFLLAPPLVAPAWAWAFGEHSALWKSDVWALRSYGPVLLAALLATLALAAAFAKERAPVARQ